MGMAFQIALSGVAAATDRMSVVSNNIANAESTGFKSSRNLFSDILVGNSQGGGAEVITKDQNFGQGNLEFTDSTLDMAINGDGFFRVRGTSSDYYTRAGAFHVDKDGFIVNPNDQQLIGYKNNADDDVMSEAGADIQGPIWVDSSNIEPQATTTVKTNLNLDSSATAQSDPLPNWNWGQVPPTSSSYENGVSVMVYDTLGQQHTTQLYFRKTPIAGEWEAYTMVDSKLLDKSGSYQGLATEVVLANDGVTELAQIGDDVVFGKNGEVLLNAAGDGLLTGADLEPFKIVFKSDGFVDDTASDEIKIDSFIIEGSSAEPMTFSLDMSTSTQYGADYAVNSLEQDGYTTGRMIGLEVERGGDILARFSNGQARNLATVELNYFKNPAGLTEVGNGAWLESNLSGSPLQGKPNTGILGYLRPNTLEQSNVDMTKSLVKMITTQRHFQANTSVIKTVDQMVQNVINLK